MAGRRPTRPHAGARKPGRKAGARRRVTRARPAPRARRAPSARKSNAIGLLMHHMAYSSHDVDRVRRFYTETLGFADFSVDEDHQYLSIQTGPSSSLGFMPPLPGPPEQWRPPREPSIHLIVKDVDRAHRLLTERGVAFEQPPTDMAWGYRTAVLRDPEGRLVCLAQSIRPRAGGRSSP